MSSWRIHPSADALADAVAADVRAAAGGTIAVPGGSTPVKILPKLGALGGTLTLTDDRWVAAEHPLSNLGLLRRSVPDPVLPLVETPTTLIADSDAANARLAALPRFDLVWLGVGGDGHSASWFPGPDLAAALDTASTRHVLAVTPDPLPPEAPVARLTLSLARVLAARRILIVATGTAKRAILESPGGLPIAAVLKSGHPNICIHWSE